MRWKALIPGFIWFWISIFLITLFSTQDKGWLIDGKDIKNICELKIYIEHNYIRDAEIIVTFPLIFPFIYLLIWKKQRHWFLYLTLLSVIAFWLWRFFFRYQFCL